MTCENQFIYSAWILGPFFACQLLFGECGCTCSCPYHDQALRRQSTSQQQYAQTRICHFFVKNLSHAQKQSPGSLTLTPSKAICEGSGQSGGITATPRGSRHGVAGGWVRCFETIVSRGRLSTLQDAHLNGPRCPLHRLFLQERTERQRGDFFWGEVDGVTDQSFLFQHWMNDLLYESLECPKLASSHFGFNVEKTFGSLAK